MILFAIYARVQLVDSPAWLQPYRQRFSAMHEPHITLKQPCWIVREDVPIIAGILKSVLASVPLPSPATVTFRQPMLGDPVSDPDGEGVIMLRAANAGKLLVFQRNLVHALSQYRSYKKPQLADYERTFDPHLTIGHDLDKEQYEQAVAALPADPTVHGIIQELVLVIDDPALPVEQRNPADTITFAL